MKPKVEVIWQSMKCAAIWQWRFKIITAFYRKPIKNQNTNRMKQNRTLRKTKPIYNTLMCASFKIFVCNLQWTIFRHNLPESNIKKNKRINKQHTHCVRFMKSNIESGTECTIGIWITGKPHWLITVAMLVSELQ